MKKKLHLKPIYQQFFRGGMMLGIFCFCFPLSAQDPIFDEPVVDPFGLEYDLGPDQNHWLRLVDIDADGLLEAFIFIGEGTPPTDYCCGEVVYFDNEGTNEEPVFVEKDHSGFGILEGLAAWPWNFVDIDGNGTQDLVYYQFNYNVPVRILLNEGTPEEPDFADSFLNNPYGIVLPESDLDPGNLLDGVIPAFEDLDHDGAPELMLNGRFANTDADEAAYFARNIGTIDNPSFAAPVKNDFGLELPTSYHVSGFVDLDGDEDMDVYVLVLASTFTLLYYENKAVQGEEAEFAALPILWHPLDDSDSRFSPTSGTFWDYQGDGDLDLLCANTTGIHLWENILIDVGSEELTSLNEASISPNPAQDEVNLSLRFSENIEKLNLSIKDMWGRTLSTSQYQVNSDQFYQTLDTSQLSNGIYLVEIEINGKKQVWKIVK